MSDDVQSMQTLARNDQANTELQDTACRVAAYFKILAAAGIPEQQAAMMCGTYNAMTLARHFGVEMYAYPMDGDE